MVNALEKDQKIFEQTIQQQMGRVALGQAQGYTVKWPQYSRADIDRDKLKTEFPEIYDQVKTTMPRRSPRRCASRARRPG